jgi:hypothetical protein
VGPEGKGSREATAAWRELAKANPLKLPEILAGMDQAGPVAANYLATAAQTVAERQLDQGGKLPTAELEKFLLDRRHAPRARRLAYEWLVQVDPATPERLLPGMLDDPGRELRRDAVARLIAEAEKIEKSDRAKGLATYRKALAAAIEVDQVKLLADRLKGLGETVDIAKQLGFLVKWKLIGPFDNTGQKGFDLAFPPELGIDLNKKYPGKHGEVGWIDYATEDATGVVDLNKPLGTEKGVTGYALAELTVDGRQEFEFRMSADVAVKLWLNGRQIDRHNVYHGGNQIDQYVCRGTLQPGKNTILVKVCQNEQTQEWAKEWGFRLRVCDENGNPVRGK